MNIETLQALSRSLHQTADGLDSLLSELDKLIVAEKVAIDKANTEAANKALHAAQAPLTLLDQIMKHVTPEQYRGRTISWLARYLGRPIDEILDEVQSPRAQEKLVVMTAVGDPVHKRRVCDADYWRK